ncbi:MAG: hypothetical protein KAR39_12795 [Thermoplasmata archaeon]|nr:hypothetical protein [Thermoplasmata archaeon]
MEDNEKEITTVWTKSNALVWVLMLVTMHMTLWSGFASYILENEVKPMFLALFIVGLGIGVMVTDTYHDWLRQKALKIARKV